MHSQHSGMRFECTERRRPGSCRMARSKTRTCACEVLTAELLQEASDETSNSVITSLQVGAEDGQ